VQVPFSLFLALRFLKPKRTFVSVITVVSVLGVTLGIAVLILVIAVMTGFDQELRSKVLGFDPHISVTDGGVPVANWRPLQPLLAAQPGVTSAAPFVQGPVLLSNTQGMVRAAQIRGIDPVSEGNSEGLHKSLVAGKFDLSGDSTLLGVNLAEALSLQVGDKITVYPARDFAPVLDALSEAEGSDNPKASLQKIRSLVLPSELTVTGIFSSGRFQYDSNILLVPLHIGQELYSLADSVHGVSAWMTEPYAAPGLAQSLAKSLPGGLRVTTWIDENSEIFDAIRLERNTMFFLLLFIVIVAAFSIMNTLITVTVMKTREIGLMKALGATRHQIVWVFLTQGMVVGIFGNLIGLGLGLSILHWRNEFKDWLAARMGIEIFPPGIYQFSQIPAVVVPRDVAIICISAFFICSLAALFPALVAARLDPVKALRHD
jgi:lipoprotein-releasing system permease protein